MSFLCEKSYFSKWEKLLDIKFLMWRISLVPQRSKNGVGSCTLRHKQWQKDVFVKSQSESTQLWHWGLCIFQGDNHPEVVHWIYSSQHKQGINNCFNWTYFTLLTSKISCSIKTILKVWNYLSITFYKTARNMVFICCCCCRSTSKTCCWPSCSFSFS